MRNNEKTTTGWQIPVELKDDFTAFCESTPDSIQEECSAALLIYMHLPSKIRELAKLDVGRIAKIVGPTTCENFCTQVATRIGYKLGSLHFGRGDDTSQDDVNSDYV